MVKRVPNIVVDAGPVGSGKTHRLLDLYGSALAGPGGAAGLRALWIAPTSRALADVRQRLAAAGLSACLWPGVTTFDALARRILAERATPVTALGTAAQRDLVRGIVQAAVHDGHLTSYPTAAESAGLVDLVIDFIHELKRRGITPDDFAAATSHRAAPDEQQQLRALVR